MDIALFPIEYYLISYRYWSFFFDLKCALLHEMGGLPASRDNRRIASVIAA